MTEQSSGQCLCGVVKFRISGELHSFFLCHCTRCRKNSGSAHSANLFASEATITWLSGEQNIRTFTLPGTQHAKSFCTDCGSPLPFYHGGEGEIVVPAGSLESTLRLRPNAHICFSSRATWDNDLASVKKIEGLPV
jgi:hypothetical protein